MHLTSSPSSRLFSSRHAFVWCLLSAFALMGSSAQAQVDWTLRDPLPTTAAFYAVARGNGTFVAVGEAGTVFSSTDGSAWTAQPFPTRETLRYLSFIQGRFYARGDSGTIFSSSDGSGWSQMQGGNGGLAPVVASTTTFLTAGSGSEFLLSTDGNAWEHVALDPGITPHLVAASPTLFVAITTTGKLLISSDGHSWTEHAAVRPEGFLELVYGDGAFVARGGTGSPLYRSVDGVTWTAVTSGVATHLSFGGGQFYATDALGFLLTSDDGLTWVAHASKPPIDTSTIATSGTRFIAVNSVGGGRLYTSPDALTWTETNSRLNWPSGSDSASGYGVAFAAGRFLAGAGFTSTDGINWTSNGYHPSTGHWCFNRPFAVNGRFVILVRSQVSDVPSEIHLSLDGISGTKVLSTSIQPCGATYGNGRYVIVGLSDSSLTAQGRALTSTDGSTWTSVANLPSDFRCTYVHFADNRFVAVGSSPGGASASLYTSTDGLTWAQASYPKTTLAATGIAYGAGRWVISTQSNGALISTDGLTWSFSGALPDASTITFANGYFVLGTSDFSRQLDLNIATSVDGLNWSFRPVPKRIGAPESFAFGNNVWVSLRSGAIASAPAIDSAVAPSLTAALSPTTGLVLGTPQTLTASVSGTAPLSYQWKYRGLPIHGATESTYTVSAPTAFPNYGAVYTVEVTNSQGTAIGVFDAEVFESTVPQIQTTDATVLNTGGILLQSYARGPGPLTYQWFKNGALVPGAIGYTVLLPFDLAGDAFAKYSVVVTNTSDTATSRARTMGPTLVTAPSSIVAQPGERVSFAGEIDSFDSTSATVQWRKNGQSYRLDHASSQRFQLTFTSAQPADAGIYDAVITNRYGSITLPSFSLTVPTGDTPIITPQPYATTYPRGESVTLTASPVGAGPYSYQWRLNGIPIDGATSAILTIDRLSSATAGTYDVVITTPTATTTSSPIAITLREASLVNLSARASAGTGEDTMIVGFVLRGEPSPESPDVLVRSIGPTLASMGVTGSLDDPSIRVLNNAQALIAENDNWSTVVTTGRGIAATAADMARFGAFPLASGSRDSAVIVHETPAGPHTALVSAISGGTGIVLNEIYGPTSGTQRLVNLSARARVSSGDSILIAGFVIAGNSPLKVLIRGVGPTLSGQGIVHLLVNPKITLFNATGQEIHNNDNWGQAANVADIRVAGTASGAFPLNEGSHDAAMLETLNPGVYTVHVTSADGTSGVALIEIYEVQ